jgi:hypothetical protein
MSITLEDYLEYYNKVINEQCAPDEKHCTCVPALRQEIKRLNDILKIFANPNNWTDQLQWKLTGSPISIAKGEVRLPGNNDA